MLEIKLNRKDLKYETMTLGVNISGCTYDSSGNILTIETKDNPNLRVGQTIYLSRKDGNDINYNVPYRIDNLTSTSFTITYKYIETLIPINAYKISDIVVPMQSTADFLVLVFANHYFRTNRDGVIFEALLDSDYTFGPSVKTCLDYRNFLFNDAYFYKSKDVDDNGDFTIENSLLQNYGDVAFTDDSGYTMNNGLIPMENVRDSHRFVYFPWQTRYENMTNEGLRPTFSFTDPRFFDINPSGNVVFKTGVEFYMETYTEVQVGLGQYFTPNISINEDIIDNYVEKRIGKNINGIIDYEKKMFEPVYIDNSLYTGSSIVARDVEKMTFNLYFRDRKITDDWSDWYIRDKSEWTGSTADTPIWNRDRYSSSLTEQPLYGDPLGVIGFDDNDVYNRNKRLAKSFIRLSFFDSPDRKKQVLQFYSTIFFDTTEMYDRYMRNKNNGVTGKTDENNYTDLVQTDEKLSLSCTFSCTGKKDSMKSSEGFYLYLYDSLLKGTKPTPLYMLVEFNHALFGKTIPMMMPIKTTASGITPISYQDIVFPKDYQASGTTVGQATPLHIDMTRFYQDLFIKVYVKYDQISRRYVWYLPQAMNKNEWVFNLYEPNINPIK